MAESAWWQTLFSGFMLDAYRAMYPEAQTQAETEFLIQTLAPRPRARVLDVPCGGGRLSLALAARGFDVTGVDLTEALILEARRHAAERGLTAEFHVRDMRDLPLPGELDHAFCMGNSFGYFDPEGNTTFLKAARQTLKPGGTFLLETHFVAESLFPQNLSRRWYPMGDVLFLHETQYDPATMRLRSDYTVIRDGVTERKHAIYQIYTAKQIIEELQAAGFTDVTLFGGLDRSPFRIGAAGLWALARR